MKARTRAQFTLDFWLKVARSGPDDCWEWTGAKNRRGYGNLNWEGKWLMAHRVALAMEDGAWDSPLNVLHKCDNPSCCNPAHLWRGTCADNYADMRAKGREKHANGERQHRAKLTASQVVAIRGSNESNRALGRQYGVGHGAILKIRHRITWHHLPPPTAEGAG